MPPHDYARQLRCRHNLAALIADVGTRPPSAGSTPLCAARVDSGLVRNRSRRNGASYPARRYADIGVAERADFGERCAMRVIDLPSDDKIPDAIHRAIKTGPSLLIWLTLTYEPAAKRRSHACSAGVRRL